MVCPGHSYTEYRLGIMGDLIDVLGGHLMLRGRCFWQNTVGWLGNINYCALQEAGCGRRETGSGSDHRNGDTEADRRLGFAFPL